MFFAAQNKTKPAARQPVLTVSVQPARLASIPSTLQITGSVAAIDLLTIAPEASGMRIANVPVEEGQWVRRGQVMAQLDSSLLQAQLQAAQARLSGSRAQASIATQPNRPQEISALNEAVRQAEADVSQRRALVSQSQATAANAEEISQRFALLQREQAVSEQDARQRRTEAIAARQAVEAAKANLRASEFAARQARERLHLAQVGGRREEITVARANVAEIEANIKQLQTQIRQTVILAPDDGLITKRDARIGDVSSPTKPMFQMVRRGELELRGQISQKDLVGAAVGQAVTVTDGIRSDVGVVWSILPTVDPATRLATVRVKLPVGSTFMPGMFARGTINAGARNTLTVPNSAVAAQGTDSYVYVYENGVVRKRPVQVGVRANNLVEVISGLSANEQVVASGAAFLNDGDAVRLGK
jgi:HlyD family secretion protein